MNLQDFTQALDQYQERIPLADIQNLLESLQLDIVEVQKHLEFNSLHYKRNLLHAGRSCQVLLLCWLNGQRSQIHDHVGSSCGVKVLKGRAIETTFERAGNGMIFAKGSAVLEQGSICANQDEDIHQVSNLQDNDACLVTLHVYSPPLKNMNVYDLAESKPRLVADPVQELLYGGKGEVITA